MVQIEVLESSPVFLRGLIQILADRGVEISQARITPDIDDEILADVYLVDVCALLEIGELAIAYVARMAERCQVVILTPTRAFDASPFLDAGAVSSVSKQDSAEALVDLIQLVCDAPRDEAITRNLAHSASPPALSGRESEVLRYISWGFTHLQTARRLGISPHTVDTYVKRIRVKLKVGNKAQLVRVAVLYGHLNPGSPTECRDPETMAKFGIPSNVTVMWPARELTAVPLATGGA